jgi:hypothetical protein
MLGADKVALRASLCASQLVGLGIMRYGIRSEPLHSMPVDALVDAIGPTMQRYLVGDITGESRRSTQAARGWSSRPT